jgi:hypothetical protein
MAATVPEVEIAEHADPTRIGRPYGKGGPGDALVLELMRAEALIKLLVRSLGEQMDIEVAED